MKDEPFRYIHTHQSRGKPLSEEHKRKIGEAGKRFRKNNPEAMIGENSPFFGRKHTPETLQKLRECRLGKNNPMYGKNGSDSPTWKGGVSFEPYCYLWPEKSKEIRERDGNKCMNPDCWNTSTRITAHHIDYDKKNCSDDNLITLCVSCNSRANKNREYHTKYYQEIMEGLENGHRQV